MSTQPIAETMDSAIIRLRKLLKPIKYLLILLLFTSCLSTRPYRCSHRVIVTHGYEYQCRWCKATWEQPNRYPSHLKTQP